MGMLTSWVLYIQDKTHGWHKDFFFDTNVEAQAALERVYEAVNKSEKVAKVRDTEIVSLDDFYLAKIEAAAPYIKAQFNRYRSFVENPYGKQMYYLEEEEKAV